MARYQTSISTIKPPAELADAIRALLRALGFKQKDADPIVWQKGGWFSNPLFLQFEVAPGELKLEAWVRMVLLPGVFIGGEHDLDGMFLIVQKRVLKSHVAEIERLAEVTDKI